MSEPYTPSLAATVLRNMTDEQLARATPQTFQMWPAKKILPTAIGRELIDAERAMRRGGGRP